MRIITVLVMLVSICLADGTETQTDWTGGSGTSGPVTTFGDLFDASSGISWSTAGQIDLSYEHNVASSSLCNGPRWAVCGDIDADTDLDVLVCLYSADSLVWYENIDGESYFWERHDIAFGDQVHTADLVDIDNDGDLDAVAGFHSDDFVAWYENDGTGGGWIRHYIDENVNGIRTLVVADINDDGHADVVVPAYSGDWVAWYENDGVGGFAWTKHDICGTNGPRCGNVADLNNDGHLDVVAGAYSGDSLSWWENDGTGINWTQHCISGSLNGAGAPWFVDIDGDTFLDVVCAAVSGDSLCWFENSDDIGTTWIRHTIKTIDYPYFSNFCDIDQDGDEDVLVTSPNTDEAFWFENNGSGTSWVEHLITDAHYSPYFIAALDINLDGVIEALICDNSSDRVDWYDIVEGTGVLESSILDAQEEPAWNSIAWTATTPTDSDVVFQLRSSDDSANMGSWSADITAPGSIDSYVTDQDNYIQYRAILSTTDISNVPALEDVTIDWVTWVSIEGSLCPADVCALSIVSANPSSGSPVIAFSVPGVCNVNLSVFDISGRAVARIANGEIEAGSYQVRIENLNPGVYFCRMEAGQFEATEKLVVLQ
ncbi:MAG: T9SS type A sorting domain-containing protein [Candidatus Sabulitectum sp.]|nr:T9SS type A sorting domain-containing protein [Candidatus Sabulitectum sp.]